MAEAVVALVVLALSAGTLLEVVGHGARRSANGADLAQAVTLQSSLLAQVGSVIPLRVGTVESEPKAQSKWRVRIAPYGTPGDHSHWRLSAYVVEVEVFGSSARITPIASTRVLRLAPKQERAS